MDSPVESNSSSPGGRPGAETLRPEDDRSLREALAIAAGGKLILYGGSPGDRYHIDIRDGGVEIPDGTTLKGRGRPKITATDGPQGLFYLRDSRDVTIEGLEIDGMGESRRALEVLAVEEGCSNIDIVDNHIHDFHPRAEDGERPRIWGIRIGDARGAFRNRDITFSRNRVENFRESRRDNVLFGFMNGFEIRRNTFADIARNTFLYYSIGGVVSQNRYLMPNARASMAVIGADTTLRNERYTRQTAPMRILNNAEHGHDLSGVTVTGCDFERSGIDINDGGEGQPLEDIEVRNCQLDGKATPHQNQSILVGGSDGGQIRDIRLKHNTVSGSHWSGILMADVQTGLIEGNEVRNNNTGGGPVPDGIRVLDSARVAARYNRVYDDRPSDRATQTHGIVFRDTESCSAIGNETWGNIRGGFVEEGETTGTELAANVFRED